MRPCAVLALLIFGWGSSANGGTPTQPNIVVFLADDHSVADSEVYGARNLRTPNMMRLAKEGMTFTQAFVASPSCAPSRAALLTGLMPARNGAEANHARPGPDIRKLPSYLQEIGYEVAAFGKVSHYKHTVDYGFDYFAHDTFHDQEAIPAALKWLQERKSKQPLCLFVGSNWPHVPWPVNPQDEATELPPKTVPTEETKNAWKHYAAAVAAMDQELGAVYNLARERFGTNLLFLHTSDHGSQFPFGKWNLYDAGVRTSFLATWPGVIEKGSKSDAMISWIDILPTLIEAAGGKVAGAMDGRSFLGVLQGLKSEHRQEVFTTHSADGKMNIYPMRSVRTAEWKYIRNLHPEFKYTTHIDRSTANERKNPRWGGYWSSWLAAADSDRMAAQLVKAYHERPPEELYFLPEDPHEERNLAADPKHAERLATFRKRIDAWLAGQGDRQMVYGAPILLHGETEER